MEDQDQSQQAPLAEENKEEERTMEEAVDDRSKHDQVVTHAVHVPDEDQSVSDTSLLEEAQFKISEQEQLLEQQTKQLDEQADQLQSRALRIQALEDRDRLDQKKLDAFLDEANRLQGLKNLKKSEFRRAFDAQKKIAKQLLKQDNNDD